MSNKELYGEIFTPFSLIAQMCNLLPEHVWTDPSLTWLDPGCGPGMFSIHIYLRLFKSLHSGRHIIKNMLHMVEINPKHIPLVYDIFKTPNIYQEDYLSWNPATQFDIIIGNPPFNHRGLIKTPTSKLKKCKDGKAIWREFIRKSLLLLKPNGYLCFIVPSIWMKPDREGIYNLLTSYKIHKIHCFNNTQTNKIFRGEAQTPTCFFLLQKIPTDHIIQLWDSSLEKYIHYSLQAQIPIPVFGSGIITKFLNKLTDNTHLHITKTSMPSSKITLNDDISLPYKNIHTCRLDGLTPKLVYKYSDKPCSYYGKKKLVMAHGMYGFPYLDLSGEFGISNRDKYVIIREKEEELKKLAAFFSTKTSLYLFEATRYRMKYLEKYIFELIPDISTLEDFPREINDTTIAQYFSLDDDEILAIQKLHKREYLINFTI